MVIKEKIYSGKESAIHEIMFTQREWARKHNIEFDTRGYTRTLNDNLYEELQESAQKEYGDGAGSELKCKMKALHSSSALVCNFFHYWRYRDLKPVLNALELDPGYSHIQFEKTYPKPPEIKGTLPHLDAELIGPNLLPVAIESKFTEHYREKQKLLKRSYGKYPHIWGDMHGCRELAIRIVQHHERFYFLDAPQLLKHILGLKTYYGERRFILIYLWYAKPSAEETCHQKELETFLTYINTDVIFLPLTYQKVMRQMKKVFQTDKPFLDYLHERYFN